MNAKQSLILVQMGSDERMPASALGYVSDLGSPTLADTVRQDRLQQIARYVPELVAEFVAA